MEKQKTMIRQIRYGQRGTYELYQHTREEVRAFQKFEERYNELKKQLTEEQNKQLDQVIDLFGGAFCEEELSHFEEGFKIGLRLGFEAFQDPETKLN